MTGAISHDAFSTTSLGLLVTLYSKDRRRKKTITRALAGIMFSGGVLASLVFGNLSTSIGARISLPFVLALLPYVAELLTPFVLALVVSPSLLPTLVTMRCRRFSVWIRRVRRWGTNRWA